jgi:hypothetical protein
MLLQLFVTKASYDEGFLAKASLKFLVKRNRIFNCYLVKRNRVFNCYLVKGNRVFNCYCETFSSDEKGLLSAVIEKFVLML